MKKKKENAILIDFSNDDDWGFIKGLNSSLNEKWIIKSSISNKNHGSLFQNFVRYIKYFKVSISVFLKRKKYYAVLSWQQFYGIILAFFLRFFNVKKCNCPNIYIMTLIFKEKKGIIGKAYKKFFNFALHSHSIKKIFVFSESECEYYSSLFGIDKSLFYYLDLGISDVSNNYEISDNKKFISAGRSNRDYSFLVKNWNFEYELNIVCDNLNFQSNDKVKLSSNVGVEELCKAISQSHAVVISLDNCNISSGQLVILQAMMFGKPVICTKNNSLSRYIINGKTGVFIDKTKEDLLSAITYINANYDFLCKNSRDWFVENFTEYKMGYELGKVLRENFYEN